MNLAPIACTQPAHEHGGDQGRGALPAGGRRGGGTEGHPLGPRPRERARRRHCRQPSPPRLDGVHLSALADAVKKQFRKPRLRSAAAEGAFKLLRQAYDTLLSTTGHHVQNAVRPRAAKRKQHFRIRCENCRNHKKIEHGVVAQGVRCWCFRSLSHPWQGKARRGAYAMLAKEEFAAVARPKTPPFACPARCPRCWAQFTSMVSAGRWVLACKACRKCAIVDVQGPSTATCTRTIKSMNSAQFFRFQACTGTAHCSCSKYY